jgi:hypothetical protein
MVMKKLLLILILLMPFITLAQDEPSKAPTVEHYKNGGLEAWVIKIDDCHYVITKLNKGTGIAHTGNCPNPVHAPVVVKEYVSTTKAEKNTEDKDWGW